MATINGYNMDCMEFMRGKPDKFYDLAVVDPPYGNCGDDFQGYENGRLGGRFNAYRIERRGGTWSRKYGNTIVDWDIAPGEEYFDELFRVSQNQIIWGANFFNLSPCRCYLIWDKMNISPKFSMGMCEFAWTSFNGMNPKIFKACPQGTAKEKRFHPTQKPVKLYKDVFRMFATDGMRILDTHGGSFSSAIAIEDLFDKCKFDICEIDEYYYTKGMERLEAFRKNTPPLLPFKE